MKVCSRCGNCIEGCHEANDAMDCWGNTDNGDEPTDAYSRMWEFAEESKTCAWNGHKEDGFGK